MRLRRSIGLLATLLTVAAALATGGATASGSPGVARYDHIFVVVEENHGFADVIGNPAAPNLNALAHQFGLATQYFGVTHPSEPNYVALLGGSPFGVTSDNPYWMQSVAAPSLISQLDAAHISWKAYLQGLPHPGFQGICYPVKCNGAPDSDPLYVSKHDGIQNFIGSRNPGDWARQVPSGQLAGDLSSGRVPAFGYVVPDECHDMHGDPPYCIDSGSPGGSDPQDQRLVATGDAALGSTVSQITGAPFWAKGNNAVAIVFDEGGDNAGCCNASPGGGQVAAVVVTSHGPRHVTDATPANHYSLLSTIQQSFGLGCLQNTCDTTNVKPLSRLFAVTGSPAIATHVTEVPNIATPTPTPVEPVTATVKAPSAGGWSVVHSPLVGTADNSLGAIGGSGPGDIWAVGNFLPDAAGSNPDATLSLADHYDGTRWTPVPTPNTGPNFNTLFGVAGSEGKAWAVGVALRDDYTTRALVEAWDGHTWTVAPSPQPGAGGNQLWGVTALSPSNVWAVGDQVSAEGTFGTLVEHWDGHAWSVVPSPDPGSAGNQLYGLVALGPSDIWAVGQQLGSAPPDQPLIEHWDGEQWSVVESPQLADGTSALYSIAAGGTGLWAVGETDSPVTGGHALIERYRGGRWDVVETGPVGSDFTNLWGVTVSGDKVWAVGTFFDNAAGAQRTLVLNGVGEQWSVDPAPSPGVGDNVLGGVAAFGDTVWAVGTYKDGGPRNTLIMRHSGS